jgi:hypothetical protein
MFGLRFCRVIVRNPAGRDQNNKYGQVRKAKPSNGGQKFRAMEFIAPGNEINSMELEC